MPAKLIEQSVKGPMSPTDVQTLFLSSKTRGHIPTDEVAIKVLWLALFNVLNHTQLSVDQDVIERHGTSAQTGARDW